MNCCTWLLTMQPPRATADTRAVASSCSRRLGTDGWVVTVASLVGQFSLERIRRPGQMGYDGSRDDPSHW
jgi:hypothetical protein